uniref:Uncharacterized protein n=1 Tax=Erythrolobus australicus TaxID=1077150 RepID=A0A7S1XIC0_9RHOD
MDTSGGFERIPSIGSLRAMDRAPSMGSFVGLDKVPSVGSFSRLLDVHHLAEPSYKISPTPQYSTLRGSQQGSGSGTVQAASNTAAGFVHGSGASTLGQHGLPRVSSMHRVGSLPRISSFYSLSRDPDRMGSASNLLALASSAPANSVSSALDRSSSFQNLAALALSASKGIPMPNAHGATAGFAVSSSLDASSQYGSERLSCPPGSAQSSPLATIHAPFAVPQACASSMGDAGFVLGSEAGVQSTNAKSLIPQHNATALYALDAPVGSAPTTYPAAGFMAASSRRGTSDLVSILRAQLKHQQRTMLAALNSGFTKSSSPVRASGLRQPVPPPLIRSACGVDEAHDEEHAHIVGATSALQALASGAALNGSLASRIVGGIEKKPPGRRHQRVLERLRKQVEYLSARAITLRKLCEVYNGERCALVIESTRLQKENGSLQAQLSTLKAAKASSPTR